MRPSNSLAAAILSAAVTLGSFDLSGAAGIRGADQAGVVVTATRRASLRPELAGRYQQRQRVTQFFQRATTADGSRG